MSDCRFGISPVNYPDPDQGLHCLPFSLHYQMDRVKRIWYLSPMRAAKVQASLRIRAVSPEPSLLAHTSSESRGSFRQKARSLAPLNGWACAVKICHDGMLEDINSLDAAQMHYAKKHYSFYGNCRNFWRAQIFRNFVIQSQMKKGNKQCLLDTPPLLIAHKAHFIM